MRDIPGRWLAVLLILSAAATGLLVLAAGETIAVDRSTGALIAGIAVFFASLCTLFRDPATRWQRIARDGAEYVGIFSALCLLGTIASYPEAAHSTGFVDAALVAVDRGLGFDWVRWYAVVAAAPALQLAGMLAYQTIFVSPALLLGYYACAGRQCAARRFLLAFWIGAVLTLILFPHVPAVGPLAYLWRGPIPYMPTSALYQAQMIPALRSHALTAIDLDALRGLVCAPSFHTTCGVLYARFAWGERPLRWPLLALNAAMLLATPVEGTHYLADMVIGALVAAAAIGIARLATRPVPAPVPRPGALVARRG